MLALAGVGAKRALDRLSAAAHVSGANITVLDLRSNDTSPDALFSVTPFPEFKFRPGRETSNSWPRFIFKSKSESLHAINNYKSAADGLSTWSNRHR